MIKILSAQQLRDADHYTIENKPIKSSELMECAAQAFCRELEKLTDKDSSLFIFCGPGNNGGDGLAIARIAEESFRKVSVFILASEKYSDDFQKMLKRLKKWGDTKIRYVEKESDFPFIQRKKNESSSKEFHPVIVDALFGSGLNKPLDGLSAALVKHLNSQDATRIAVDIPSGLFADQFTEGETFSAHHTITFQHPKLSLVFAENFDAAGDFHVVDIGLDENFIGTLPCDNYLLEQSDILQHIKPRKKTDHKGKFGHAFIHAGNTGKMGAAIMCAQACARTGAGLTTVHVPKNQSMALNIAIPEAMTEEYDSTGDLSKYNAFAFGPGIGTEATSRKMFLALLGQIKSPVLLDADALNILAGEKNWPGLIPVHSILTPHPKEFERLTGKSNNWEILHSRQKELSMKHSIYIVLKGAYTCITTPIGKSYFNPTGNAGMAKGGSGDVLTGMIVSLLAQHYSPEEACIVGVYLHGLAGDISANQQRVYSMTPSDLIANIGSAYGKIGA